MKRRTFIEWIVSLLPTALLLLCAKRILPRRETALPSPNRSPGKPEWVEIERWNRSGWRRAEFEDLRVGDFYRYVKRFDGSPDSRWHREDVWQVKGNPVPCDPPGNYALVAVPVPTGGFLDGGM